MLKDMIKESNHSVYAVAKAAGIPYTTLNELVNDKKNIRDCSVRTIAVLADYFGVSIDSLYNGIADGQRKKTNPLEIKQTWQENRYKKYRFPAVKASATYDAASIHPLKQKVIFSLTEALKEDARIEKIILFGSSTTIRCNRKSDIDLAVQMKSEYRNDEAKNAVSEMIQQICNWNADIVWIDRIKSESKLCKNVERGVRII